MLRSFLALAVAIVLVFPSDLNAALVTSNIGVAGTFDTSLTGGGTATLNGATGTLR